MALPWTDVLKNPAFQSLDDDQKERARREYFDDVVASQIRPEEVDVARAEFDADTGPIDTEAADYFKAPIAGGLKAAGYGVRGIGQFTHDIGDKLRTTTNDVFGTNFQPDEDMLRGAGDYLTGLGNKVEQSYSPGAKAAIAGFNPTGNVFKPEGGFSFGDNVTPQGVGLRALDTLGQVFPIAATALVTRGGGMVGQMGKSAGVAAAMGGGAAAAEEGDRIRQMKNDPVKLSSVPAYRALREEGVDHDNAVEDVARIAESGAFWHTAPVSALTGLIVGGTLSHAGQRALSKIVGTGAVGRILGGVAIDAPLEGAQEVAELSAQQYGASQATGEPREIGQGSFGEGLMGMIGGAGPAALGGLTPVRPAIQRNQPADLLQPETGTTTPFPDLPGEEPGTSRVDPRFVFEDEQAQQDVASAPAPEAASEPVPQQAQQPTAMQLAMLAAQQRKQAQRAQPSVNSDFVPPEAQQDAANAPEQDLAPAKQRLGATKQRAGNQPPENRVAQSQAGFGPNEGAPSGGGEINLGEKIPPNSPSEKILASEKQVSPQVSGVDQVIADALTKYGQSKDKFHGYLRGRLGKTKFAQRAQEIEQAWANKTKSADLPRAETVTPPPEMARAAIQDENVKPVEQKGKAPTVKESLTVQPESSVEPVAPQPTAPPKSNTERWILAANKHTEAEIARAKTVEEEARQALRGNKEIIDREISALGDKVKIRPDGKLHDTRVSQGQAGSIWSSPKDFVQELLLNRAKRIRANKAKFIGLDEFIAKEKEVAPTLAAPQAQAVQEEVAAQAPDTKDASSEVDKAKAALDAAGVTGVDRTSTIAAVRRGDLTADDVVESHAVSKADAHVDLFKRAQDGDVTADEFKAAFDTVLNSKDAITTELLALTKDGIFKKFPGLEYRYKNEKKADIVNAAYRDMIGDFTLGQSYSYGMGKNSFIDSIRAIVNRTTDDSLAAFAAEMKTATEERAATRAKALAGMESPETLQDYQRLMGAKLKELGDGATYAQARRLLTQEQREKFDQLSDEKTSAERTERASRKAADRDAIIRAPGETVGTSEIIKTKHTKHGHDLWQFELDRRVPAEEFKTMAEQARRLGGNYSSYRGGGAIPGWQFRSEESAKAFKAMVAGDATAAKEVMQARRDEFADDRSQTAVERLTEMAASLEQKADESLGQSRKANTDRRARQAANAVAAAEHDKALAKTMTNLAAAIKDGKAKFLDRVRQKVQVEMLNRFLSRAKYDELRSKYPTYGEQQKHEGEPPTVETVDHAEWPSYTAYRSDLANLGRQLQTVDGMKLIGNRILSVADDVSAEYTKFANENLLQVSRFRTKAGELPKFPTKLAAERSIEGSGHNGKAIPLQIKKGQHTIVLSPSEAMRLGIWKGDNDKRITLRSDIGAEIVEKAGRRKLSVPHVFETTHEQRKRLAAMGIETPAEFRAALREFVKLREAPKAPDKIKEMERAMIRRKNDGLDFFPTPAGVADAMVEAAGIQEGMSVLEPSAGMGHIAERIREFGIDPDVVEMSGDRRELLEAKGFNVVGTDFMEATGSYDRVIMNPPFSDRRDALHVQHAYDLLKPGGRLVAIVGEGVFFGSDKKATAFRDWLEQHNGTDEKLEEGTFKDPSLPVNTSAAARMVVIDKPADAKYSKSQDRGTGLTLAEATTQLSNLIGSRSAQALIESGRVVLVENEGQLPAGHKSEGLTTKGVSAGGKMYFNLSALDKDNAQSVFAHEGFHDTIVSTIGEADYARLMKRMDNLQKLAKNGSGTVGKFFKKGMAAILADTKPEFVAEELAAYSLQEYLNAPRSLPESIAKWVKDFLAAIKVGLMRALPKGSKLRAKLLDSTSEADLARLAIVGLRRAANGVEASVGDGAVSDARYSKSKTADKGDITDAVTEEGKKKLRKGYVHYVDKVIDSIDHWTSPMSALPQAAKMENLRNLAQGDAAKWDETAATIHKIFNKASQEDQKAIYDYLTTKGAALEKISAPIQQEAVRVKAAITHVGKMLVEKGVIPEESRQKYEDAYLPQVYFAYLLGDNAILHTGTGKKISQQGYAKARKYVDKTTDREIRDVFLGEIKDPGYLAARAIAIPMRDLALINWLEQISANPEWVLQNQMVDYSPPWGGESRKYSAKELRGMAAKVKVFADEQADADTKKSAMKAYNEIKAKAKEAGDTGMAHWNLPAEFGRYIFKPKKVTPFWLKSQAASLRKRAASYQEATHKQAAYKLADSMDEQANQVLEGLGADKDAVPDGYKQMPDSPRYGALRGLIVRKAIYDDIAGISDMIPQDAPWVARFLGYGGTGTKFTQLWKWAKVAANPPGQVRNFVSNMIMLNLSGMRPDRIVKYFSKAVREVHSKGAYFKMSRKHGMNVSTFAASEFLNIEKQLVELERQAKGGFGVHSFKYMGAMLMDKTGKMYQWSESVAKLMKMMHEIEVNKLTEEQAVHEANKWTFDYTEVNPTIRYLRNAPIGVPFVTYATKALPRLLEVATKHPLRLLPYAAVMMGIPMMIASMYGVDDDDFDKLKTALPEWLEKRGNTIPMPYKDEQGRWQFVDIGYFLPWSQYWGLAKAAGVTGHGSPGDFFNQTGALAGPFPSVIAAITTGKDPFTDREIINEFDPAEKKFVALMQYAYGLMMPPWLVGVPVAGVQPTFKGFAGHAYDALTNHVDKYGDPTSTAGQAALRLFGVNTYAIDPAQTRAERVKRMMFEISQVKSRMKKMAMDRNLDAEDRKAVIEQYREEISARQKKLQEYAKESTINPKLMQ